MLRVLPPTFKPVCFATNQVVASCKNTDLWLDKITRKSRYRCKLRHLFQNKLSLGLLNAQNAQILLQKVELLITFCNNILQPATTWRLIRGW